APLCPAGHLPHLGGDRPSSLISPIANLEKEALSAELPISPLVGEMSGRTEGGAVERQPQ
ncbi:MAG: lytic murein transglycosylase, partial [Mesorhizobium sp.]